MSHATRGLDRTRKLQYTCGMRTLTLVLLMLIAAAPAAARSIEVVPRAGYQFGTHLNTGDGELELGGSPLAGLIVDVQIEPAGYVELGYTRAGGTAKLRDDSFGGETELFEVAVHSLQGGGLLELKPGAFRPIVSATLGVDWYDPDAPGVATEARVSGQLGVGAKVYLSPRIGIRTEARIAGIFFSGNSAVFCDSGTCLVTLSGRFVARGEVSGGLVVGF